MWAGSVGLFVVDLSCNAPRKEQNPVHGERSGNGFEKALILVMRTNVLHSSPSLALFNLKSRFSLFERSL
jgi:hypothetical protein